MRKVIILVVFVVAGLAYGASDAWKTKSYQQWDASDIKQVLWSSPWVKYTTVPVEWKRPAQGPPSAGQAQGSVPSNGANGNKDDSQSAPSANSGGANAAYLVRWNSALTIREALARQAVLDGKLSEAQAQQYVNQAQPVYQVQVSGPDMTPFMQETSDTLKSKTYIEVKPSKKRISPSAVEITKAADGTAIQWILFSFPKQGADGQPLFGADEKQAQFDCKLKDLHLNAGFDLRKMAGQKGPDL
ncbi:MAG: hypothetical protein WBE86_09890 [Candidatus Acidiferrales bacterium]